jgi:hypothetical protein
MLNALRLVAQVLLGVALREVALGALSPLTSNQLARQAVDPAQGGRCAPRHGRPRRLA